MGTRPIERDEKEEREFRRQNGIAGLSISTMRTIDEGMQ